MLLALLALPCFQATASIDATSVIPKGTVNPTTDDPAYMPFRLSLSGELGQEDFLDLLGKLKITNAWSFMADVFASASQVKEAFPECSPFMDRALSLTTQLYLEKEVSGSLAAIRNRLTASALQLPMHDYRVEVKDDRATVFDREGRGGESLLLIGLTMEKALNRLVDSLRAGEQSAPAVTNLPCPQPIRSNAITFAKNLFNPQWEAGKLNMLKVFIDKAVTAEEKARLRQGILKHFTNDPHKLTRIVEAKPVVLQRLYRTFNPDAGIPANTTQLIVQMFRLLQVPEIQLVEAIYRVKARRGKMPYLQHGLYGQYVLEITAEDFLTKLTAGESISEEKVNKFLADDEAVSAGIQNKIDEKRSELIEAIRRQDPQSVDLTKIDANKNKSWELLHKAIDSFLLFCPIEPKESEKQHQAALIEGDREAIVGTFMYLGGRLSRAHLVTLHRALDPKLNFRSAAMHFGDAIISSMTKENVELFKGYSISSARQLLKSLLNLRQTYYLLNPRQTNSLLTLPVVDELLDLIMVFHAASFFTHHAPINGLLIKQLEVGKRLFLPALVLGHVFAVEVKRLADDRFKVNVLNSGAGIEDHVMVAHGSQKRYLYYQSFEASWAELEAAQFFISELIEAKDIATLMCHGRGKLQLLEKLEQISTNDQVSAQKAETCSVKSLAYLVKWFFREKYSQDAKVVYDWFKTWLLNDRLEEVKAVLAKQEPEFKFDKYQELSANWNLPARCKQACSFAPSTGLLLPIERHAILRRLGLALQYGSESAASELTRKGADAMKSLIVEMKKKLERYDPELPKCYGCLVEKPMLPPKATDQDFSGAH